VAHHVVDTWIDPRSGFSIPCRWRIELRNARATAQFTISGFARSYYLWNNLRRGVNVLYWWLAESTGVVEPAGERPLRVSGAKHVVHQNRAFYHYS
jgi:hypothetical protein